MNDRRKGYLDFQSPWDKGFNINRETPFGIFLKDEVKILMHSESPPGAFLSYRCDVHLCSIQGS